MGTAEEQGAKALSEKLAVQAPAKVIVPIAGQAAKSAPLKEQAEVAKQAFAAASMGGRPKRSFQEIVTEWLDEALATAPPPHQEHPARHLRDSVERLVEELEKQR